MEFVSPEVTVVRDMHVSAAAAAAAAAAAGYCGGGGGTVVARVVGGVTPGQRRPKGGTQSDVKVVYLTPPHIIPEAIIESS